MNDLNLKELKIKELDAKKCKKMNGGSLVAVIVCAIVVRILASQINCY